jgi:hypothetical protein
MRRGVGADWLAEAFQGNFAQVFEGKSFADAQLNVAPLAD